MTLISSSVLNHVLFGPFPSVNLRLVVINLIRCYTLLCIEQFSDSAMKLIAVNVQMI